MTSPGKIITERILRTISVIAKVYLSTPGADDRAMDGDTAAQIYHAIWLLILSDMVVQDVVVLQGVYSLRMDLGWSEMEHWLGEGGPRRAVWNAFGLGSLW